MKLVKALQLNNFTDRSKVVLLLWIMCVVCVYVLIHILTKGEVGVL